jgi:hypothetical protein
VKQLIQTLKTEKQFPKLFRAFLFPIGLFFFLIFSIPGIAAACGKTAVFNYGQAVTGWRAILFCIVGWLLCTFINSGIVALIVFLRRTVFVQK